MHGLGPLDQFQGRQSKESKAIHDWHITLPFFSSLAESIRNIVCWTWPPSHVTVSTATFQTGHHCTCGILWNAASASGRFRNPPSWYVTHNVCCKTRTYVHLYSPWRFTLVWVQLNKPLAAGTFHIKIHKLSANTGSWSDVKLSSNLQYRFLQFYRWFAHHY